MKKGRLETANFVTLSDISFRLFGKVSDCILHISGGVVGDAFSLIELTLRFQFLVAGQLASRILDRAFCLFRSALDVFAIHFLSICLIEKATFAASSRSLKEKRSRKGRSRPYVIRQVVELCEV